jgi:hypothetical protein
VWRKKKVDELVVVKLLNRAKSQIDDPLEVNRLLREVGKFFDPMTGKAMLEGVSRAEVMAFLEEGRKAEALARIDRYIENYQRRVEPEASARSCADQSACAAPPGAGPRTGGTQA